MNNLAFIVDDDPIYQEFMKSHMHQLGYEVRSFFNGDQCISSLYLKPRLVILDHHLGGESGLAVLKKIKSVKPKLPVIYLSAQRNTESAAEAVKAGAYEYIEKNSAAYVKLRTTLDRLRKPQPGIFRRWWYLLTGKS